MTLSLRATNIFFIYHFRPESSCFSGAKEGEVPASNEAAMNTVIRPAKPQDAAAIAAIYNEGIRTRQATFEIEERSARERLEWLSARNGRYPVLVAEKAGEVVGWASLDPYSDRTCYRGVAEFSIYIAPGFQGQGIGRRLLEALLKEARRHGHWKVLSRVFPFNTASRALCRTCGFREVGVYEKHAPLDGRWEDVIIVERLIPENIHARPEVVK